MIGDFGKYFQNKIKKLQDNASIAHDLVTHHSTVFQNCYFILNIYIFITDIFFNHFNCAKRF